MQGSNIDVGSRVRFVKAGAFGRVFVVLRVALNFDDIGHLWFKIRRVPMGARPCVRDYWVRDTDLVLVEEGVQL